MWRSEVRTWTLSTLSAPTLVVALAAGLLLPGFARAGDTQGFIYGRVTTRSDNVYEGRLRWNGKEEAFWGDLFNGTKEERPYLDVVPERDRRDRRSIRIMGIRIGTSGGSGSRPFQARFGDIERIDVRRGDEAIVTMKGGEKYELEGGSNDLGARIYVWDNEIGEVKLDWDRIETIEFLPTPADIDVPVTRLHGTVETDAGTFKGYVQWDQEECLSTDKLDGDTRDGDLSIEMGKIASIERLSSRSSRVTLWSGREFELDGSNDVDDDNRGIYVEDPRFGRVLVSWDAFERVDFAEAGPSGPAYDTFEPARDLRGTVKDRRGRSYSGRIIYDVDEAKTWEFLTGEKRDVEYHIPFALIRRIEPRGDWSLVTLVGGEELELEDSSDVGDGNDGVVVLGDGDPAYIEWDDIESIEFGS